MKQKLSRVNDDQIKLYDFNVNIFLSYKCILVNLHTS